MQVTPSAMDGCGGVFAVTVQYKGRIYHFNHRCYTIVDLEKRTSTQRLVIHPYATIGGAIIGNTYISVGFPYYWVTSLDTFDYMQQISPVVRK